MASNGANDLTDMTPRQKFGTIDEYLDSVSPDVRGILEEVRQTITSAVPGAKETIGYGMPAFRTDRIFIYFAAFKKHIGIYPPVRGDAKLDAELLPYRGEKGNLKFPLSQPMPYDLIRRVAETLVRQYASDKNA
jgi:uncharacterized protein YdhG (YjbR/CyaY superfamily)